MTNNYFLLVFLLDQAGIGIPACTFVSGKNQTADVTNDHTADHSHGSVQIQTDIAIVFDNPGNRCSRQCDNDYATGICFSGKKGKNSFRRQKNSALLRGSSGLSVSFSSPQPQPVLRSYLVSFRPLFIQLIIKLIQNILSLYNNKLSMRCACTISSWGNQLKTVKRPSCEATKAKASG